MTSIEKKAFWLLLLLWVSGFAVESWVKKDVMLVRKPLVVEKPIEKLTINRENKSLEVSKALNQVKKPKSLEKKERNQSQKININKASLKALKSLPGIGSTLAKRIIKYRIEVSDFKSSKELVKVKGIGKRKLEKLLPFIEI
jgi:comEA protein